MDLRTELDQRLRILARTTAREWERELKRTSPVDTGLMRNRTTVRDSGRTITATADTPYAEYVRTGTRPHKITARRAQALRFQWHGQTVIVRSVNHPGTQPNSWWDDALEDLPETMQRIWRAVG